MNNMKKPLLTLFTLLIIAPALIGKLNHNSVIVTVQNFTDKSDGSINDVLRCYNFNLTWEQEPTLTDYYNSGLQTIINF